MKFSFFHIVLLLFVFYKSNAQPVINNIEYNRDSVPVETIYLQTNQESYIAGETIWFKAYLYSSFGSSMVSTNFFAILVNSENQIVFSVKLPVINGTASGQVELPDTLTQGLYILKACSGWTINNGEIYIFKKIIPVFNPSKKTKTVYTKKISAFTCRVFTECGRIVTGLPANIVLQCSGPGNKPARVAGTLFDSKGNDLGAFTTDKNGNYLLSYTPEKGVKYLTELQLPDNSIQKIELPAATEQGLVLTAEDDAMGKMFSLMFSETVQEELGEVTILGIVQDNIVFEKKFRHSGAEQSGVINTAQLPPGIMQLIVLDKKNKPVAQRNVFVNTQSLYTEKALAISKADFSKKALNELSITLPDTLSGSFSVSVTDFSAEKNTGVKRTIINELLLQAGNKNFVFANTSSARHDEVDKLAIIYGSSAEIKKRNREHTDEGFITIRGDFYGKIKSKDGTKNEITFIVEDKDSTQSFYTLAFAADGKFYLTNLNFEDSARILYQVNEENIVEAVPQFPAGIDNSVLNNNPVSSEISMWMEPYQHLFEDTTATVPPERKKYVEESTIKSKQLKEVVVVAKRLTPKQEVNKKYTSGLFTNTTGSRTLDFINEPPRTGAMNVLEYLRGKVAGLQIIYKGGRYTIQSQRSVSIGDMTVARLNSQLGVMKNGQGIKEGGDGFVDGKVFLNETEVDMEHIVNLSINDIALVKFFPPGSIFLSGVGNSCILAVYTKKTDDIKKAHSRPLQYFKYPGYSVSKKFTGPDYSTDDKIKPDYRTTLFWEPNLVLDGSSKEFKIRFYNNDAAKKFRIVLEGIADDGRLVYFEKIIE